MAMCCVKAAVDILHPGRPLQLATGGDRNERFSPLVNFHLSLIVTVICLQCQTVVVSLNIAGHCDTSSAGADSLWRSPDLFIY